LPLGHGKLAEEVLIDLAESVSLNCHWDCHEILQERDEKALLQIAVRLGQNVFEVFVLGFNRPHCLVDGLADVAAIRQIQQVPEPSLLGNVQDTLCLIVRLADPPAAARLLVAISIGWESPTWSFNAYFAMPM
jgi:hypothetical protein